MQLRFPGLPAPAPASLQIRNSIALTAAPAASLFSFSLSFFLSARLSQPGSPHLCFCPAVSRLPLSLGAHPAPSSEGPTITASALVPPMLVLLSREESHLGRALIGSPFPDDGSVGSRALPQPCDNFGSRQM